MAKHRRVLVFSASFGGGHVSAAGSIKDWFKAHSPEVEVRVIDFFDHFAPSLNVVGKFAYGQSVQFFPELYGTFFDLTNKVPNNPFVHELAHMGYRAAGEYIDAYRPDAVISTYPIAGGVVADMKTDRSLVSATVITDYGAHRQWLHPATDMYFVASDEVESDLIRRGIKPEHVRVSGIPISERFANAPSRAEARATLGLRDTFTVMLTSAAGTPGDLKSIVRELVEWDIQVVAVTGRNDRLRRRLQSLQKRVEGVHVYGFMREMETAMAAADLLVGKAGGLTVSEALAMGLPLVIYNPVPGQEIFNVDFLVNWGAGFEARDEDDVVSKVRFLSQHPARLAQMAGNAAEIGKPNAAQTICETVLAALDQ